MSETFFAINDLARRKLQTSLTIISIGLCVGSSLFLLLLGDRIGFGILSMSENKLTSSFSIVFWRFILFVGLLVFVVSAIIISFMVFVMMAQRTKDIGLMKAAGCPNDLVFGYFMNELMLVTLAGCLLGVITGVGADYVSAIVLSNMGLQMAQGSADLWLAIIIFVLFLVLSLVVGAKPVLDATKIEPAKALSPTFSLGLTKESDFKGVSRMGLTLKLAIRSLFRRKSASLRVVLCLICVFMLLTVAVGGGIIADQTTKSWVENAVGRDLILVAHQDMVNQYRLLLSKFYKPVEMPQFNYNDSKYLVPQEMLSQLQSKPGLSVEARLVMEAQIEEAPGIMFNEETGATTYIGDHHKGTSLIVGVEPQNVHNKWFLEGSFIEKGQSAQAVIGDSVASRMFSEPLSQTFALSRQKFNVTGVCIDPINNGNVTFVPLSSLENITGILSPNVVLVSINSSTTRNASLNDLKATVKSLNLNFEVYELNDALDGELGFLDYIWSTIMFLPLLSMTGAILCLIGYVVLALNEQRQEFGILRAVGAKPKTIVKAVAAQNSLILLSGYGVGISLGMMTTMLILIPNPMLTILGIAETVSWLLVALVVTLLCSLIPVVRFARRPIVEAMTNV